MSTGTLSNIIPVSPKPTAGVYDKLYLMSLKNYQEATKIEADGVVSAITLTTTGERAFYYESRDNGFQVQIKSKKENTGATSWYIEVSGYIEARDNATKELLDYLTNNRVTVIARLRGGVDADSYKILGIASGLTAEDVQMDSSSNGGSHKIVLHNPSTPVENNEPEYPLNFWKTDLATTNLALEALLVPVV